MPAPRPQSQARAGTESIAIADRRRTPFLWCSLDAMAHLRGAVDGRELLATRSLYFAMAELAARAFDGRHDGFSTSRAELAAFAGISERRLGPYLERLRTIGLVEILEQRAGNGASLPNLYRLVDAPVQGDDDSSPLPTPDVSSPPRQPEPEVSPPTRTRPNRGEEVEERERERARTPVPEGEVMTELEAAALAELGILAAERADASPVRSAAELTAVMRAHPDVDPLEAARRLRAHYGDGGKAANRPISSYAGLMRSELERSAPFQPAAKGRRGKGAARGMTAFGLAERATAVPGIPLESGGELEAAWNVIRGHLEASAAGSAWDLYLEPLRMLGERTDRTARTIVLESPAGTITYLRSSSLRAITAWCSEVLGPVAVEIVPEGSRIVEAAA